MPLCLNLRYVKVLCQWFTSSSFIIIECTTIRTVTVFSLFFWLIKVDKVYLGAPPKIAIIDHEKKRTFVLAKDGLPDIGTSHFLSSTLTPTKTFVLAKDGLPDISRPD